MKTLLASLLVVGTLASAAPVAAEPRAQGVVELVRDHGRHGGRGSEERLSERRISRVVYRSGFAEIEDIHLRRDRYIVTAVRPNGAVFRLVLDAYDGALLDRERLGWSRGHDRRDFDRHRSSSGVEFRLNLG